MDMDPVVLSSPVKGEDVVSKPWDKLVYGSLALAVIAGILIHQYFPKAKQWYLRSRERRRVGRHRRDRSGSEATAVEMDNLGRVTSHGARERLGSEATAVEMDNLDGITLHGAREEPVVRARGWRDRLYDWWQEGALGYWSGIIKTYARRPDNAFHDGDFPRKRIRMDTDGTAIEEHLNMPAEDPPTIDPEDRVPSSSTAPSSSPAPDQNFFSDPITGRDEDSESQFSTPPPQLAPPELAPKKPTFSFLKRKRSLRNHDVSSSAPEPLTDIAPNIQPGAPRPTKKTRLTQMQIDLGGEVQKACKACGMEYIPSNKEDAALHKDFHAMNIGGVDVGKHFLSSKDGGLKRAYPRSKRWRNQYEDMVMVDRKSPLWARNKVKKVLEVVNTELGSADIEEEQLWAALIPNSERHDPTTKKKKKKDSEPSDKAVERFKAFLHIEREKCIGFCLAEKITNARRVIDPKADEDQETTHDPVPRSSSISTSADPALALLGIARIWTSKSHRSRGIAAELLETARGNFFYGMEVPKELVAFSQPTESGGKLAERWFGCKTGWHVYGKQG
ncbi:MAG: hypothetical protein Q9170_001280 [Blastenia crenularia]